jgi:predicted permease
MTTATRLYGWLLRLYPAAFRDEYGDEMTWAFAERSRTESGWRVWPRTLLDVATSAVREHADVTARDLRVALRSLSRTPALTVVVVIALALGIGANTAVYTVVRQVLWQPLPYEEPGRLAVVLHERRSPVPPAPVIDLREQVAAFSDVGAAELWGPTLTGAAHPERLPAMRVTPNMFSLLGVDAALGRTPRPDDLFGIVIGHRLWQERFGSDRNVIGRDLQLEGVSYTVIGVMPPSFVFAPFWAQAEAWGVLDLAPKRDDRRSASLRVFARLRDGATFDVAQQQVAALSARLAAAHPVAHRHLDLQVQPLHQRVTGDVQPLLWTLLVAVGCVLLVTCVNVASLLLARAIERQPEMTVRAALGGRSAAITRQLLTESFVLAGGGAAAGLALACWLVSVVPSMSLLGLPRLESVSIDWRMAAVAGVLSVATGLLFGLAPVWTARRGLRLGARGASESKGMRQVRSAFVIAEVMVAVLLVVTAGLLVRSFQHLASVDPGFRAAGLVAFDVSAHASPTWRRNRGVLFTHVLDRVRDVPGVTMAGAVNHVPLAGDAWGTQPLIEGRESVPRQRAVWRVATPGYLGTLGVTMRDGRDFTPQDIVGSPGVVIVNETFARRYLDGQAVGRRLSLTPEGDAAEWRAIVGVIGDVRQQEWSAPAEPEVYVPLAQTPSYLDGPAPHTASMTVVARTTGDPRRLASAVRDAIWAVDADLALSRPIVLEDEVERQIWRPRFASALVSGFGLVAALLAAAGIYGLVAHDASRRTREIGIRLALGAPIRDVVGAVLVRGLALVTTGVGLGVLAALAGSRRLEHVLFDVPPHDVGVFGLTTTLFVLVGLAASGLPAWRAARVNAAAALRAE